MNPGAVCCTFSSWKLEQPCKLKFKAVDVETTTTVAYSCVCVISSPMGGRSVLDVWWCHLFTPQMASRTIHKALSRSFKPKKNQKNIYKKSTSMKHDINMQKKHMQKKQAKKQKKARYLHSITQYQEKKNGKKSIGKKRKPKSKKKEH